MEFSIIDVSHLWRSHFPRFHSITSIIVTVHGVVVVRYLHVSGGVGDGFRLFHRESVGLVVHDLVVAEVGVPFDKTCESEIVFLILLKYFLS